jgi:hypothetical protein
MTIAELARRGKALWTRIPEPVLVILLIMLASSAGFGLGLLEGREMGQGGGPSITTLGTTTPDFLADSEQDSVLTGPTTLTAGGEVVASKNGTKYFFPWCGGAKLIKEENKVWFASANAAKAAGYAPAANCKGL